MFCVDIAVCTYRRKSLLDTLDSIKNQKACDNLTIKIIVVDNDVVPSAKADVQVWLDSNTFNLDYIHAPSNNISIARNACLHASTSQYLIFIDDDEVASDYWLNSIVSYAQETNADVVFGPVKAIFESNAPSWLVEIDLHSTKPVFVKGFIQTGYTGNTLLNLRSKSLHGLEFDLTKGKTGGEDSDFFTRAFIRGAVMRYCEKAYVSEKVPANRATLGWLVARRTRVGHTYGATLLTRSSNITSRLKNILFALSKFFFCFLVLIFPFKSKSSYVSWYLRGCFHFGVIKRLLGVKEREHY